MKFDAINYPNGKIEIPPFIEEEGIALELMQFDK